MRRGSSPKVTRPVRWLHSDVTARMPTTGRMSAIGIVVAWRYSPKACWPPSLKNMIVRATAMIAPMPMSSQRPARVSSILRSSTWTRRPNGTPVVGLGPAMRLGTAACVGSADSAFLETGALVGTVVAVLLVAGDRDGVVPPATGDEIEAALPNVAPRVTVEDCGHNLTVERPEVLVDEVRSFL